MKNNLISFFENHQWKKIALTYSSDEIVKLLSFRDCLRLSYRLLYNDEWDNKLQEYAVKLLNEIRKNFPNEWNYTWEYDALLGMACYVTHKYDERYEAYRRAFDKIKNPPPGLLIEFARSCICPGSPPISYDNAIDLVKKALEVAPYADGIGLLSHIYSLKDDEVNADFWTNILKTTDKEFVSPSIEPKFLVEDYLKTIN